MIEPTARPESAETIKALLESYANNQHQQFHAVALQVAAKAARDGHSEYAAELKPLVDKIRSGSQAHGSVDAGDNVDALFAVEHPDVRKTDMCLPDEAIVSLERLIAGQTNADRIRSKGFAPARNLLINGLPGTGKAMTAKMLATELSLPLFVVNVEGASHNLLERNADKMREALAHKQKNRAVYLIEGIKSLQDVGRRHSGGTDNRTPLPSFIRFLEDDSTGSVTVATTDHQRVGMSTFLRFDIVLDYPQPDAKTAERLIKNRLAVTGTRLSTPLEETCSHMAHSLVHAEIVKAAEQAAEETILHNKPCVEDEALERAFKAAFKRAQLCCDRRHFSR